MADWMAFHVDDYVSNTMHLTARQHGGYILLICAAWKSKGCLPGSDAALMAIAKLTPKEWREDGDALKAFLTRRGDFWVHERVEFEWKDAQALIEAKSRAGKAGARKRWNGRGNGTAMAGALQNDCQTNAPVPLPKPSVSNNHTVANSAPHGASAPGRARLIADDWNPSESDIANLRKNRPDLTGAYFDERMGAFRRWCKAKAVWTHDEATTWLDFMLGSYVRDQQTGRRTNGVPVKSDLPPEEPWEKRVRDFQKDGFWIAGWGPKPGEAGCRAPVAVLRSAA